MCNPDGIERKLYQSLGKAYMCELLNYVCQPRMEHPKFVPHWWSVYHIRLYSVCIEEQDILRTTRNRPTEAIRKYKRPSRSILADISNKLEPPTKLKLYATHHHIVKRKWTPSPEIRNHKY